MREWLKNTRKNKGYTQLDIATKCNISRAFYSELENNLKNPSIQTAKKIGSVLGFEWTNFFNEKCC